MTIWSMSLNGQRLVKPIHKNGTTIVYHSGDEELIFKG